MAPNPDKKKTPAQTSTEATQMLVAKCSRSTLEALILKSVLNAAPITLADLEATPVPSVSPVVASMTTHLKGGGLLSLLPFNVLMLVLSRLSTECKLHLVITTCKALRTLRSEGALWSHIDARKESSGKGWIGSNGLVRLLRWLSDPTAVKALSLTCTKENKLHLPYRPHEVPERGRLPTPVHVPASGRLACVTHLLCLMCSGHPRAGLQVAATLGGAAHRW